MTSALRVAFVCFVVTAAATPPILATGVIVTRFGDGVAATVTGDAFFGCRFTSAFGLVRRIAVRVPAFGRTVGVGDEAGAGAWNVVAGGGIRFWAGLRGGGAGVGAGCRGGA